MLSLGNLASRILGQVREMLITYYFGAEGAVSAFRMAATIPSMIYEFLIGGMLSAALVPVLSDYARAQDRTEFNRLVSILLSLIVTLLSFVAGLLYLFAPQIAQIMAPGFDPDLLALTIRLIRLVTPAILFFCLAGGATAVLYSLQRFSITALASAIYNLGIVIAAPFLAGTVGIDGLAIGILAGSLAQLLVLAWDLRRAGLRWQFRLDWRHPGLRRIVRLYLPIGIGLLISIAQIVLDRNLTSRTGAQSLAWMANATNLQQLPLGLISVVISLAALPTLSQYYAAGDEAAYRHTLGRGLRMVILLMAPAAVALWVLGEPIVRVLFERGKFTPQDTVQVVAALNIYLIGMLFAAIDFPLNYAFYARNNTWLPALVGVISAGVYTVVALLLVGLFNYLGLVWADTAKQAAHALIMAGLLWWYTGRAVDRKRAQSSDPSQQSLFTTSAIIVMAALLMVVAMRLAAPLLFARLPTGLIGDILRISLVGGIGVIVYAVILASAGLEEFKLLQRRFFHRN